VSSPAARGEPEDEGTHGGPGDPHRADGSRDAFADCEAEERAAAKKIAGAFDQAVEATLEEQGVTT